jgi:hypothetical protein
MTNPMAAPGWHIRGAIRIHGEASHDADGLPAWHCGRAHRFVDDFVAGEMGPLFLAACRPCRAVSDLFLAGPARAAPNGCEGAFCFNSARVEM